MSPCCVAQITNNIVSNVVKETSLKDFFPKKNVFFFCCFCLFVFS